MRTIAVLAAMSACTTPAADDGFDTSRAGELMPDIGLVDVNATSATFGEEVSAADHRGRVSAWYFGHST